MSNKFCRFLSNQARIEYGQFTPCCWFGGRVSIENAEELQQKLFLITDWKSAEGNCSYCEQLEIATNSSPRLNSLTSPKFNENDADGEIINLEIQIDKDCNAACLICDPANSTTWEKYQAKLNQIPIKDVLDSDVNTYKYFDQIVNSFSFSELKSIRILGGEPLRNDNHLHFLKHIPHPEKVIVNYTTNGSYRPSAEVLDGWRKFKQVKLTYSIDAVGEQFNYLRWPLQWKHVEGNIRHLVDLNDPVVQFNGFSYTTTPLSLFYHDRYVDWAVKFFAGTSYNGKTLFNTPGFPRSGKMLLSAVPDTLAECLTNKYGVDHCITQLLTPHNTSDYHAFIDYITYHDHYRQLDWKKAFPDMVEYFTK